MVKIILYIILILVLPVALFSQTLKELEQRKKKTEQELAYTTNLLSKTQQERIQTVNQLNILKKQITLRKRLIEDIVTQINILENDINDKMLIISGLQTDLTNLKKEYSKLIQFAQKKKSDTQVLVFIFAAEDFNQAYRRLRFYQQFLRFRQKQAQEILTTKKVIESELSQLSITRNELSKAKDIKGFEISNLNTEENRFSVSVKQLQRKEQELRKEIEERKKAMEALNKAITDLIKEEARRAAEEKVDKVRDARHLRISDGFTGNKGRLPWPTAKGVIVGEFGEHDHPVIKGIKIRNNGVDISSNEGDQVMSIFEGEVKKVVSIPGQNLAVIIRHGEYLTVYSNLVKVSVKVGDVVSATQAIGEVFPDKNSRKGIINLQIWKESKILNPKDWILP